MIEVVFVIATLIALASIGIPQFSKIKQRQVLNNATSDIKAALSKASSNTLAGAGSVEYGVHFQTNNVILFTGTTYSSGAFTNETTNIISPAIISNISLTGGGSDIYFSRLWGTPNKTGTVTVTSGTYTKTITIGATGIISIN